MSELINKHDNCADIRWKLLTGVSGLALIAYVSASPAVADEATLPQIWIEIGGQLSRLGDGQDSFAPRLMDGRPTIFAPSQRFEYPPHFSIDGTGTLTFQPHNSDWKFSASIKFGRSSSSRRFHQQTHPAPFVHYSYGTFPTINYQQSSRQLVHNTQHPVGAKFSDTNVQIGEQHTILDFEVGKDVGLGLFGNGSSVVNIGVRFAQFSSRSNISLNSNPDWHFKYKYNLPATPVHQQTKFPLGANYHSNAAALLASRNFHGVGPSLSWNASAPVAGNTHEGELSLDWGIKGALLFGRQRAKVHHQTTGRYHSWKYFSPYRKITYKPAPFDQERSRSVTVPNLGGSLGLSYRMENFKVSAGYRADFFIGAMDGGIDSRKSEDRGFFGPYASVTIGLGE